MPKDPKHGIIGTALSIHHNSKVAMKQTVLNQTRNVSTVHRCPSLGNKSQIQQFLRKTIQCSFRGPSYSVTLQYVSNL